ncbi:MAG: response regulator, partial [Rhodobacteraceae bacterium]|nr:response regulator [Paracoccaceae bacterium]
FSKIEAGKLTIEVADFSPFAVMDDAVEVLQSIARQKETYVAAISAHDVPQIVRGDEARVRQILLNLIGNSVKFTDRGGIQVRMVARPDSADRWILRYEVHDSGSGFKPENADKLFEAFEQDNSNKDVIKGTGLGLSICKKLVESFGGTIGCEGAVGEGASFWFEFPVTVVKPARPSPQANLSDKKVLLVGDGSQTTSAEEYFESRGAFVARASNVADCKAAARQAKDAGQPFDLAVIHYLGIEENWWEVTQYFRELNVVPACLVSDISMRLRREALRHGFSFLFSGKSLSANLDHNIEYLLGQITDGARQDIKSLEIAEANARLNGKNVLVLEDSLVNQTVISRQLRLFGIQFTIAADGQKGLEALDQREFDCILCDCSMPVMNGFEFTRIVREREAREGENRHRIIIALTANAFREDEEKCKAAGMDDFMSKPVTLGRLSSALDKWIGAGSTKQAPPAPVQKMNGSPVNGSPAIDLSALTDILGTDDRELQNGLLTDFVHTAHESLAGIEGAFEENDFVQLKAVAHKAKGESRSMGAAGLGDLYAALEEAAKAKDAKKIEDLKGLTASAVRGVEEFVSRHTERDAP